MTPAGGIIDCHVHPTAARGEGPGRCADEMLRFADRLGIEWLGTSLGPIFLQQPTEAEIEADNDFNAELMRCHPDRFFGYANVNPNYLFHSLREIDRRVADGPFVGIKMWVAMCCDHPNVDAVCERAAELDAPVLQHTFFRTGGNLPGESSPDDVAALAARHPTVTFIAAHAGLNWERGIRAVADRPNVLVDTCGFDPEAGFTEMAVRWLGAERVVYGSDAAGRSFASQLAKVLGAEISDDDRRRILSDNMRRVLDL
ncbi:MAG: amidohydrolase family protein [Armatimonadota bacterium]